MRRLRWAILVSELMLLALVLVVPPVDLPQTAFNEADTPINQATVPVVLSCRSAFIGLSHAASVTASLLHRPFRHFANSRAIAPQQQLHFRPLLALLCTFLC